MAGSGNTYVESGGLICIEAENATRQINGTTHSWAVGNSASFANGQYLRGTPSNPTSYNLGDAGAGTLEFDVSVVTAGTWYVWTRFADGGFTGDVSGHDSLFVEYAGSQITNGLYASSNSSPQWVWGIRNTGTPSGATVSLSAGIETIVVQMREVTTAIDRILLTTNANYNPASVNSGEGPTESSVLSAGSQILLAHHHAAARRRAA